MQTAFGIIALFVGVFCLLGGAFLDCQDYVSQSENHRLKKRIVWIKGSVALVVGLYLLAPY